jgi:hypothetical protein
MDTRPAPTGNREPEAEMKRGKEVTRRSVSVLLELGVQILLLIAEGQCRAL